MYHMVRSSMHTSQARDRLLAAAVRHALDAGIADLSLRQIAAAIGTSHRMLIYHFGSREGLLVAVTQAVEEQQRSLLLESGAAPQDARESWVAPIAAAQVEAGADEPTARAEARLGVAVVRGLLLDLLATGDRAGTTAAFERFIRLAAAGPEASLARRRDRGRRAP